MEVVPLGDDCEPAALSNDLVAVDSEGALEEKSAFLAPNGPKFEDAEACLNSFSLVADLD
jgi:hypothetical protein